MPGARKSLGLPEGIAMFEKLRFLVCSVALVFANQAHAETWNLATPYPDDNYMTVNNRGFADEVKEGTDGRIMIKVHANASLLTLPQIKPGVQQGQVEIGEIIQGAFALDDPFFGIEELPMLVPNHDAAYTLWLQSRDKVAELLESQGLKLLHAVVWPPQSLFTNMPVNSLGDLKGERFRIQSPKSARLAQLMGTTGTQVEVADIPQAFLTNMIRGMYLSTASAVNLGGWDFLKHAYLTNAWYPKNLTFMSLAKWNSLSAQDKHAIEAASERAEKRGWDAAAAEAERTTAILREKGMDVSEPSPEFKKELSELGEQMLQEWLVETGDAGAQVIDRYRSALAAGS